MPAVEHDLLEQARHRCEILERSEAQGLVTPRLVVLRTATVLRRAGALSTQAEGIALACLSLQPVLDAELVLPPGTHVVDVGEPGMAAEAEALQRHVRGLGAELGRAVADCAEPDLVEMQPFPAHGGLDDAVQLLDRERGRNQHSAPDHRADAQQAHLQLQDRAGWRGEGQARPAGHHRSRPLAATGYPASTPRATSTPRFVALSGSYYRDKYHRLRVRRGRLRAAVAIAHKILVAAYHMLAGGVPFRELGEAFLDQQARQRNVRHLLRRLNHLGYDVMLQPRTVEAAGP